MNETPSFNEISSESKLTTLGIEAKVDFEGAPILSLEAVCKFIQGIDAKAVVTDGVQTHDKKLCSVTLRAPDSTTGYSYMHQGKYGQSSNSATIIYKLDITDIYGVEEIYRFIGDAWKKS